MKVNVPFHPVKLPLIITGNVLREFRREIATIFSRQLSSSLKSAFQIDAFRLFAVTDFTIIPPELQSQAAFVSTIDYIFL